MHQKPVSIDALRHYIAVHYPALTQAELHICEMLLTNKRTKEIAEALQLSERTVENHRASIRKKLGIRPSQSLYVFLASQLVQVNQ